jgi:SAM-dependent methyltransferase
MGKVGYFLASAVRAFDSNRGRCPSCDAIEHETIMRKYVVTSLRRCANCQLMYRFPTDPQEQSEAFYDDGATEGYEQGFTTTLPSDEELNALLKSGFAEHEKDYSYFIDLLNAIKPAPARVFDFGCSWGYGSWQIGQAGYDVRSYEISNRRRGFAIDKLGVAADTEFPVADAAGAFDIFFSSHVLEHLPALQDKVAAGAAYLRPGGTLVAITPNGADAFRQADPSSWRRLWGEVHPNLLDEVYFKTLAGDRPYFIASTPVNAGRLAGWSAGEFESRIVEDLTSDEIFVAIRY